MLAACGDVEFHFLATAVDGTLDAAHVGDQGAQLYAGDFTDGLIDLIGVGHLGHCLGVHERAYLDHLETGVDQAAQQHQLLLSGQDGLFVLQSVAQTDLTQADG